jgi:hypothetical protein
MVCFCDIPVELSCDHRSWYGNYAIGFSKVWGKVCNLNPVFYVSEDGPLARELSRFSRAMQQSPFSSACFSAVWPILPYLKPIEGAFPDYRCPRFSSNESVKFQSLSTKLKNPTDTILIYLSGRLPALAQAANAEGAITSANANIFLQELNAVVTGPLIYDQCRFSAVQLRPETLHLLSRRPENGKDLETLNRMLLEDGCSEYVRKKGLGSEIKPFEDEMEWRFVPQNAVQHICSFDPLDCGLWAIQQKRQELKAKAHCEILPFQFTDVQQIVVCDESEKNNLARNFPALGDKITTWNELGISCEEPNLEQESC